MALQISLKMRRRRGLMRALAFQHQPKPPPSDQTKHGGPICLEYMMTSGHQLNMRRVRVEPCWTEKDRFELDRRGTRDVFNARRKCLNFIPYLTECVTLKLERLPAATRCPIPTALSMLSRCADTNNFQHAPVHTKHKTNYCT